MQTFQDAERVLAESLPGYQSRPSQQKLAAAINSALDAHRHLIAEAGTGTGKSLAYLIESVLSGQRVVIATATKALQDQVAGKDLPFLTEHLDHPFTYAVLKGRSNYLCPAKARSTEGITDLRRILEFAEQASVEDDTFFGERDDFPFAISDRDWMGVAAETEECSDNNCKSALDVECYAQLARIRAAEAQVVVVNHALICSDLQVRELSAGQANLLGNFEVLIVDEAHELESYASNALGVRLKESGFTWAFSQARNAAQRHGFLDALDPLLTDANRATQDLWSSLESGRLRPSVMAENSELWGGLYDALTALHEGWVANSRKGGLDEDDRKANKRVTRSLNNLRVRFGSLIADDWTDMVRFVEEESRQQGRQRVVTKAIRSVPINVGTFLRELLFDPQAEGWPTPTCVLVSATLAVNGSMGYVASRLGVDTYDELDVGHPFDYPRQARLYVPTDIPAPTPAERQAWSSMMRQTMYELVRASDGRALLLFTSYREMAGAYDAIADRLPYMTLRQGLASNRELAETFAGEESSVLFATRSFFTGVDFQGTTCSLVCIDKLPFPVPTDPIVEARQEEIERKGGNAFSGYAIPEMTLPLKQGFGRLIRHANDTGVVAILDPRLVTKGYGRTIIKSLPDAPLVTELADVEEFFDANRVGEVVG